MGLVVVDVQKDFCEGGYLPVPNTTSLIEDLNNSIVRNQPLLAAYSLNCHFNGEEG